MSLQDNLRNLREQHGFKSAKKFAELIDVSYTTYMSYESRGSWPSEDILIKISNTLGVTPNDLLGFSNVSEYEECKRIVMKYGYTPQVDGEKTIITLPTDPPPNMTVTYNNHDDFTASIKKALSRYSGMISMAYQSALQAAFTEQLFSSNRHIIETHVHHATDEEKEAYRLYMEKCMETTPPPPATKPKPKRTRKPKNEGNS